MSLCSSLRCARKCVITFSRTLGLYQQQRSQIGTGKTSQALELEQASQTRPDVDSTLNVAVRPPLPIIVSRQIDKPNPYIPPKQAWLESMDTLEGEKLGLLDLHPDVFGAHPRYDILWDNIIWQQRYKHIDYRTSLTRAEVKGGGRKPWPQKGTGRHRAGSIRAPQWHGGGMSHGPRGPRSFFYMLPKAHRAMGLRVALTVKYVQNDLHIVDSLEIPTDDPEYIRNLIDTRYWGFSALFIDDTDMMPRNISLATNELPEFNLMPVYGLNVYSMLKHETLVLTLAALEKIEQKLLEVLHSTERAEQFSRTTYKNYYGP